jgi:hypothetical protein
VLLRIAKSKLAAFLRQKIKKRYVRRRIKTRILLMTETREKKAGELWLTSVADLSCVVYK